MDGLFFAGVIDRRRDQKCVITNWVLLASSLVLMLVIGIKFVAALQFEGRNDPEPQQKYVIVSVPCFNEGAESLKTCIHSIAASIYAAERMLIFVCV
jgi:chitin synthase